METEEALNHASEKLRDIRKLALLTLVGAPLVVVIVFLIDILIFRTPPDFVPLIAYLLVSVGLIGVFSHKWKKEIDKMKEEQEALLKRPAHRQFRFR
jgi:archaellum biogenesis protein FlaJ (TadC family)